MGDNPEPLEESKHSHDFERVVTWASAFSIAVAAGFLASLKQVNPTIQIRFSVLSVLAFFAGGTLTILFFRWLMRRANATETQLRGRWGIPVAIVTIGTFLCCVFFAIRNVSHQQQKDVIFGTSLAAIVLTFVGWLCWRIVCFLESDEEEPNEHDEKINGPRP